MLLTVKKYFWILNLGLLTLAAWVLADSVNAVVRYKLQAQLLASPPVHRFQAKEDGENTRNIQYFDPIIQRNIFDSRGNLLQKEDLALHRPSPQASEYDPNAPCVPTALPVELVGTLVAGDPEKSSATILEKRGGPEAKIYRIGDMVLDQAQLVSID